MKLMLLVFTATVALPSVSHAQALTVLKTRTVGAAEAGIVAITLQSGTIIYVPVGDVDPELSIALMKDTAPPPRPTVEAPPSLVVLNTATRVTEVNTVFFRSAWQADIRNPNDFPVRFTIEIQYQDSAGFVVERGYLFYQVLQASARRVFGGDELVRTTAAFQIAKMIVTTTNVIRITQ